MLVVETVRTLCSLFLYHAMSWLYLQKELIAQKLYTFGITMSDREYWFCMKHHKVEGKDGCPNYNRLGPYHSPEDAARALEKIKERNQKWDNDPSWKDNTPKG